MHAGVLRDIAQEERAKEQLAAGAGAASASATSADCEGGVCDLKQTRFRDPATGLVAAAPVASGATA